jgi:hypothetical protein
VAAYAGSDVDVKLQEEFNNGWNRMKETWGLLAKKERDAFNQMLEEVRDAVCLLC